MFDKHVWSTLSLLEHLNEWGRSVKSKLVRKAESVATSIERRWQSWRDEYKPVEVTPTSGNYLFGRDSETISYLQSLPEGTVWSVSRQWLEDANLYYMLSHGLQGLGNSNSDVFGYLVTGLALAPDGEDAMPPKHKELYVGCEVNCDEDCAGDLSCEFCEGEGSFKFSFIRQVERNKDELGVLVKTNAGNVNSTNGNAVTEFLSKYFDLEKDSETSNYVARTKPDVAGEWQRICYVFIGSMFVYVDVPFALKEAVIDVQGEMGPWGLGSWGRALTLHNVFLKSSFGSDPAGTHEALSLLMKDALIREGRFQQAG